MPISLSSSRSSGGYPVRELIVGYYRPKAESNFDNVGEPEALVPGTLPFGSRFSDNTDGAWVEWYVSLAAGTWTLDFRGFYYNGSGILAFTLDGTALTAAPYNASNATVDTYSAASSPFSQTEICSNLTIATAGTYTLRATVTGKNASSSGFATNVIFVYLNRTG